MVLPVVNSLNPVSRRAIQCAIVVARIGGEDVARKDARESLRTGLDGVSHVGVVVSVARRGLDQSSFPDSCAILFHDQLFDAHGALL